MDKIIRRTVTITITETWTIVWTTADEPQGQAATIAPYQPKIQEEAHEMIHTSITTAEPGPPSASDPTAAPSTPAAAPDPQPDNVSVKPDAGRQRKRARRRRSEGNP